MKTCITILIAVFFSASVYCQQAVPLEEAEIVFNGAYIVMHNKTDLVVKNSSRTALNVKNGGGIISEDSNSNVIWSIANDTAYSVPFVAKNLEPITVSFSTSNGTGAGAFTLSTYSGAPNWKNSDYLPPGITNVNRNGKDDSKHLIDRFWKIEPNGYTKNPRLTNIQFGYRDIEWSEDSNAITEKNLQAQNWNGTKWTDAIGIDKPSLNYVKINAVSNYYTWWALVDSTFALPLQKNIAIQRNDHASADQGNIDKQTIYLAQNFPNPFSNLTTVNYSLPQHYTSAKIIITDKNGNALQQIILSGNRGSLKINVPAFASGVYQYTLYIDGKLIDTKQMEHIK